MINFNKLKKSDYLARLTKRTYFQPGGKIFDSREQAEEYANSRGGEVTYDPEKRQYIIKTNNIFTDTDSRPPKPGTPGFKLTDKTDEEYAKELAATGKPFEYFVKIKAIPGNSPYQKYFTESTENEEIVGFKSATTEIPPKTPTKPTKGIDLPYAIEEGSSTYVTGIENIEKLMRQMSEMGSKKDLIKGTAAFRVNEDGTVDTTKPLRVYTKHLVFPGGMKTALNNVSKQVEQKKMGFTPSGPSAIHENVSEHSLPDKMKQGGTLKDRLLQCGGRMKKAGGTIKGNQYKLPDFLKKEIL